MESQTYNHAEGCITGGLATRVIAGSRISIEHGCLNRAEDVGCLDATSFIPAGSCECDRHNVRTITQSLRGE